MVRLYVYTFAQDSLYPICSIQFQLVRFLPESLNRHETWIIERVPVPPLLAAFVQKFIYTWRIGDFPMIAREDTRTGNRIKYLTRAETFEN